MFSVNLSQTRTPLQRYSECSKLGNQTLWPLPVRRQIGPPVLYVKLLARKLWPAGYSKPSLLLQPNCGRVPLSKLLCILGVERQGEGTLDCG